MQSQTLMRNILAAKIILVLGILAIHQGWIHVGDVPLIAADQEEKKKEKNEEKKDEQSVQNSPKTTSNEDITTNPQDVEKIADSVAKKEDAQKRKSFLSDLFTLPKLNAKSAKREEVGKYLDLAERKERQIIERTEQLARREEQLKRLESAIDQKLGKLDEERKFLAKTIQQEKDLKGERIDKIAELFEKMEPKKAAPQFEKLDKDLTVALFKKLKQKQVTTILESMNPEKSVELTEYFARVKSAREYDILKELNESLKKEFQDCKGMPVAAATPSSSNAEAAAKTPDASNNDTKTSTSN
jgi:flagellar motility protein MotE (MotC chaperone)